MKTINTPCRYVAGVYITPGNNHKVINQTAGKEEEASEAWKLGKPPCGDEGDEKRGWVGVGSQLYVVNALPVRFTLGNTLSEGLADQMRDGRLVK